jgi:DNA replication and repair protein RecF
MRIDRIALRAFRNISDQTVEPGPRVNLVLGQNGQGKTNLVEGVAFLSWLRSFRTSRTADLVRHGDEAAALEARVAGPGATHDLGVGIGPGWRRATVDGKGVRSARECLAVLTVVCLSPDDPAVLEGGPEGRRALLDRLVVLLDPERSALLARLARLLKERNALLRAAGEAGRIADAALLEACEEALAAASASVLEARRAALARLQSDLPQALAEMSGTDLGVDVRYVSRWAPAEGEDAARALRERLAARRVADVAVGYTTAGPQADDLEVDLLGLRARGHASRGQKKILMLAWKVAEARLFTADRGEPPVLVLDDALADLDPARQARVVRFLEGYPGQSFVTGAAVPEAARAGGAVFRAEAGRYERES